MGPEVAFQHRGEAASQVAWETEVFQTMAAVRELVAEGRPLLQRYCETVRLFSSWPKTDS